MVDHVPYVHDLSVNYVSGGHPIYHLGADRERGGLAGFHVGSSLFVNYLPAVTLARAGNWNWLPRDRAGS